MRKKGLSFLLCLMLLLGIFVIDLPSAYAEAEEVTDQCTFTLSDKADASYLADDKVLSRVSLKSGKTLSVTLPTMTAPVVYVVWYELPDAFTLIEKGSDGKELTRRTVEPKHYYESYTLSADCVSLEMKAGKNGMVLSTLRIFEGSVPVDLPCYNDSESMECDLLLITGEPHGVLEHFGALLPYYFNGLNVNTGLVIAHIGTRKELHETTLALWSLGYTRAPLIGEFVDDDIEDYNNVKKKWTERKAKEFFTECFRKTKARVVVTEDTDSTEPRAKFTAEMALESWTLSVQANQYKESAEAYGTHEVEKFYTLSASGTVVDASEVYYSNGDSLQSLLTTAYRNLASRQMFHIVPPLQLTLTLRQSTVGKDNAENDILENLSTDTLRSYESNLGVKTTPTPAPTDTPEPTLAPTDTPEPTPTEAPTDLPVVAGDTVDTTPVPTVEFTGSPNTGRYLLLGIVLAVVMGGLLYCIKRFVNKKLPVAALWILPLLIGLLIGGLCVYDTFSQAAEAQKEAERLAALATAVPTDTPAPTEEPTLDPTEEPTPEPTEESTPEPTVEPVEEPVVKTELTDFDLHFLNDGRTEVVEKDDDEAGEWIYRSDILSVEIQRHEDVRNDEPVVYLVAHIYMRDFFSFQPTFPSAKKTGLEEGTAQSMAERYHSVLWITGDNIIHGEKEKKGVLIRNGRIYSTNRASDVLVLDGDTLSLQVVSKSAYTAQQLLESGVENTYSFFIGPKLVIDGQIHKDTTTRTQKNPRCGIGQVEPGHFVAIVADGRQDEYSNGLTLTQFAELFIEEGCSLAYNLDGGVSTCMIFMGKMLNKVANNNKTGHEASWLRQMPDGLSFGYTNLPGYYSATDGQ